MDDIDRFWSKVDVRGPDDCWEWQPQSRRPSGYGRFYTSERASAHHAHRWILGHLRGKPLVWSRDLVGVEDACHRCDNPPCVNPAHLYVGTRRENVGDAVARSRLWMLQRTHCPKGHEYVQYAKRRKCRECERPSQLARNERRRAATAAKRAATG